MLYNFPSSDRSISCYAFIYKFVNIGTAFVSSFSFVILIWVCTSWYNLFTHPYIWCPSLPSTSSIANPNVWFIPMCFTLHLHFNSSNTTEFKHSTVILAFSNPTSNRSTMHFITWDLFLWSRAVTNTKFSNVETNYIFL